MSRAADLRADFDLLGSLLADAEGSGAAAIARERRLIGVELEKIEAPEEVPFVDELARRRGSGAGPARPAARRRNSG